MRNRTLLSLMEMLIMVMVFSAAAAICLRAFVYADSQSRESGRQAQAALLAQSAAEVLAYSRGDLEEAAATFGGACEEDGIWTVYFDENGKACEEASAFFTLEAAAGTQVNAFTAETTILVKDPSGAEIFSIPAAWQTESGGGR